MSIFDEQLKKRRKNDDDIMAGSLGRLKAAVSGKKVVSSSSELEENALQSIFSWFGVKAINPPSLMEDFNSRLEFMLNPTGIMKRKICLSDEWWKDGYGPILAFLENGLAVALLPGKFGGYEWTDYDEGKVKKVGKEEAKKFQEEAFCFYRPFPLKEMNVRDFIQFSIRAIDRGDIVFFFFFSFFVGILGLVAPYITEMIFNTIIPLGNWSSLAAIGVAGVGVTIAFVLIQLTKNFYIKRMLQKVKISVENAAMSRVLHIPVQFFKEYNAGELQSRIEVLSQICDILGDTAFSAVVSGMFSIIYIFQIYSFAPSLNGLVILIIALQVLTIIVGIICQSRVNQKKLKISAKLNGLVFRLFSGIQKIKLSGAEKRAFAQWAKIYADYVEVVYNPPILVKIQSVLFSILSLGGMILIYAAAMKNGIGQADYMAFLASYGLVSGAIETISLSVEEIAQIKPLFQMAEPILKTVPEVGGGKKILNRITGNIELSNVSFRYTEDGPWILDKVNLKIRPRQYVAIVGKTGCGKSTLMRLLLGFETPVQGAVLYDNQDIQTVDLRSLRQKIGVVLQNSKLFAGDIYSNIVISAPWLTVDDAWEAAALSGVDSDIKKMPMGMQTIVTEGGGGISGGQRQRLMIARAIAPKPKVLMFDEATSALDNVTQKIVSESLERLKCTRIVIAHRLSTVRHCDRIIVLDQGKIVEDGTYEQLLEKNGFFAELVRRQQVDEEENER